LGTKLKEWISRGFDLGNHTYSHSDINDLSPEQVEEEIMRGESTAGPLMEQAKKSSASFVSL
jgi:peptidoglycan/xylan/chitin deacetylase (PgdA/CDA1 family)